MFHHLPCSNPTKQEVSTLNIPHTPCLPRLVAARMDDTLKKAGDARRYAVSLGALEYSGDLAKQLMYFSDKMEKTFKQIQELHQKKVTDTASYSKFFSILDEKFAWYQKAEARSVVGKGLWYITFRT